MKDQETCFEGIRNLLDHFAGKIAIMIDSHEIRILPACCITDKMMEELKSNPWWAAGDDIIEDCAEQYVKIRQFILESPDEPGRGTFYVRYYPPGFRTDKRFAGDCFPGIRTSVNETKPMAVMNSLVEAVCKFQKYVLVRESTKEFDFSWYTKDMDSHRRIRMVQDIGLFGIIGTHDLQGTTDFNLLPVGDE